MNKILGVAFMFFLLVGCTQRQFIADQHLESENQTGNQKSEQGSSYVNSKYHFTLNFPSSWDGYVATEIDDSGTICFSIPSSGSRPFCIFQLYVLPAQNTLLDVFRFLGQTHGWNIVTDKDVSCVQFTEFQCERAKEVPDILETFAIDKTSTVESKGE